MAADGGRACALGEIKKLKMASQYGFNKEIYALANLNYFP